MKIKKVKNSKLFLIVSIVISIVACKESNTINISIDNAKGLETGAKVICMGREVGKVSDISFFGTKLNIRLKLESGFSIPKQSQIMLISTDILGTKAIEIDASDNKEFYSENDTLVCIDRSATRLDSTFEKIDSIINVIADSIIIGDSR